MIKKTIKVIAILILLIFILRGAIYRLLIDYREIGAREVIKVTNELLKEEIEDKIAKEQLSINEIDRISREITNRRLKFTFQEASTNPNKTCESKKTNCIGYSALYTSISNYILEEKHLEDQFSITHKIGKLSLFGNDLHKYIDNPFFKDHDFVEINNKSTGETRYVDPSVSDYLRINYVKSK